MAGFLIKLPQAAVEQLLSLPSGPIVDIVARLIALMALLCFTIFAYALWLPKMASTTKESNEQRQQSSGQQLKKKGRAKKHKKVPVATSTRRGHDVECILEEDLEKSSDVEAPSPNDSMTVAFSAKQIEACTGSHLGLIEADCAKEEPEEELRNDDLGNECATCDGFGCSAHRTYTTSLLLLHREIARGPPGLVVRAPPGLETPERLGVSMIQVVSTASLQHELVMKLP
jgi:hypothetical protein